MRAWIAAAAMVAMTLGGCASHSADMASAPPAPPVTSACVAESFNIYFESWQTDLNPESQALIDAAQKRLVGCTIKKVRIVGMAGAPGDEAANLKISQERAEVIAAALEKSGWPRSTFEIVAIGEKGAVEDGMDKPMRRRVKVSVEVGA